MSAIAEILLTQGYRISGSDRAKSSITETLEKMGACVFEGQNAKNLPKDTDILVYSSAVSMDNPEIVEAAKRKIPIVRRAEMLAEVMRLKYGIGIAGTHGKTTTTSMTSLALIEGGLDPTVIVGGNLSGIGGTNARLGEGDFIVVEADEYDRTFLALNPTVAVLTNMEADHLDCYEDLNDIRDCFIQYANKVPFYGFIVLCLDEPNLRSILPNLKKNKIITYGIEKGADLRATHIEHRKDVSLFVVEQKEKKLGSIVLQTPGNHNVRNALAAIAVGLELEIPFSKLKRGIEDFAGVKRRWERKGKTNGILVYDDYAHHPTECAASISGAKSGWDNRIVCVFQPHLFSRTRDFYKEFAKSLSLADVAIVVDVYPAREKPIVGVTSEMITDEMKRIGHKNAHYIPNKEDIPHFLQEVTKPDDLVITMGAGDIWKYGEIFLTLK